MERRHEIQIQAGDCVVISNGRKAIVAACLKDGRVAVILDGFTLGAVWPFDIKKEM